jgi:hypothetical protein
MNSIQIINKQGFKILINTEYQKYRIYKVCVKKKSNFNFIFFIKIFVNLKIAPIFAPLKNTDPWCNGSTADFGSAC